MNLKTNLKSGAVVSTVLLPMMHPGGIYETMVFPAPGNWRDLDCRRYYTETDAIAGHEAMVARWQDRPIPEEEND